MIKLKTAKSERCGTRTSVPMIDFSYVRPSPRAMSRPRSDPTEAKPLLDAEAALR